MNVGSENLTDRGAFVVGHDLSGGASVGGNLTINTGGVFSVGHNLVGLSVTQGSRSTPGGNSSSGTT